VVGWLFADHLTKVTRRRNELALTKQFVKLFRVLVRRRLRMEQRYCGHHEAK
jgi:hypothetical protein